MKTITSISFGCFVSPWQELLPRANEIVADADEKPGANFVRYIDRLDRVKDVLAELEAIGLVDDLHGPPVSHSKMHVTTTRRWSTHDIESAEFCRMFRKYAYPVSDVQGFDVSSLDGDPRLALELTDARIMRHPWLCAWALDVFSIIVRRDGLERVQNARFSGFELRPTRQYITIKTPTSDQYPIQDASKFSMRTPKPKHEWWQLYPLLELPQMHSSVGRVPLGRNPPPPGGFGKGPGMCINSGEPFDDFQCVWSRSTLNQVGPFDIARTWETRYQPPHGAMIIVSQKAAKYFREIAGDMLVFVPVRIVEE